MSYQDNVLTNGVVVAVVHLADYAGYPARERQVLLRAQFRKLRRSVERELKAAGYRIGVYPAEARVPTKRTPKTFFQGCAP